MKRPWLFIDPQRQSSSHSLVLSGASISNLTIVHSIPRRFYTTPYSLSLIVRPLFFRNSSLEIRSFPLCASKLNSCNRWWSFEPEKIYSLKWRGIKHGSSKLYALQSCVFLKQWLSCVRSWYWDKVSNIGLSLSNLIRINQTEKGKEKIKQYINNSHYSNHTKDRFCNSLKT